jgi:hypothetical protein
MVKVIVENMRLSKVSRQPGPGMRPVLFIPQAYIVRFFYPILDDDLKFLSVYLTKPLTRTKNSVNFSL